MVHPYSRIVLSNIKEWHIDTLDIGKSQDNYAELKKSQIKKRIITAESHSYKV